MHCAQLMHWFDQNQHYYCYFSYSYPSVGSEHSDQLLLHMCVTKHMTLLLVFYVSVLGLLFKDTDQKMNKPEMVEDALILHKILSLTTN